MKAIQAGARAAMASIQNSPVCHRCGETRKLRAVTPRIARCDGCGFLLPSPTIRASDEADRPVIKPAIAPSGVLRGKYRLIERLGEGAHGVAYLAEHVFLSHPCVVKVLPQRVGESSDVAIGRLRNEARAGFRVNDPHVVRVLDCDVVHGTWYFIMEYVEGADLGVLLQQGLRVPWEQGVSIATDAARGLAAIHRFGLVHRDIKPSNLILGVDGAVRVADLGVAGLAQDHGDAEGVRSVEIAGTLAYAAPETFRPGSAVGPRADLFSLGATVFQLVTGRLPHHGGKIFQRLIDLQCRQVQWPADAATGIPTWFVEAVLKLLAIEPEERFESPAALIEHLQNPVDVGRDSVVLPAPESLEPRGIGVLPFENEPGTADDDWLGYALANHLSRALASLPGVYVADQDGLVAELTRREGDWAARAQERLLTAGRLVGAGTVISGRFTRSGGTLRVQAEAFRAGHAGPCAVAVVEGNLAELDGVQQTLFDDLVCGLGLTGAAAQGPPAVLRAPVLEAREKLVLGRQAFLKGDYEEAVALGQRAVELDPQFGEAIGFIGVCWARMGKYEQAEAQHRRQEALAAELDDGRLGVEALANMGVMNYFRGDYEAAEGHFTNAARMAQELHLAAEEAQICNNLGFVLFRLARLPEAEEAFHRAIKTHRAYGGLTSLVGPYNGMGNVLVEQRRYVEARGFYRRALALAAELENRTSVGITHVHLGRCAALEGRFAEAKHEFTMALNVLEETRFWNGLARAYEYIAEMNLQLGNCDEAVRCADKRIELARQHSNVRMESAAWIQKAESLRKAGRLDEAAECLALGRSIEDADAAASRAAARSRRGDKQVDGGPG